MSVFGVSVSKENDTKYQSINICPTFVNEEKKSSADIRFSTCINVQHSVFMSIKMDIKHLLLL